MADNILGSGIGALNELKKELRAYNANKESLDSLKTELAQTEKKLAQTTKELNDSIEKTVKKRREEVSSTYDKEITKEQDKLKSAHSEKNKAKEEQVKERIKEETLDLVEENANIRAQIKAGIAEEGAPGYVRYGWYYLLFMPKGAKEYIELAILTLVFFLGFPAAVCFLLPENLQKIYVIVPVYGLITVAVFALYNLIEKKTLVPYNRLLLSIREARTAIKKNKKKIKKITRKIRKDRSDDRYELDEYTDQIKNQELAVESISDRKQEAINFFDKNTKQEIIDELNSRYMPTIDELSTRSRELKEDIDEFSEHVKEQSLYLSENYEAYIGKEFMKEEKIDELMQVIKSGQASTVSLAIQVVKTRR